MFLEQVVQRRHHVDHSSECVRIFTPPLKHRRIRCVVNTAEQTLDVEIQHNTVLLCGTCHVNMWTLKLPCASQERALWSVLHSRTLVCFKDFNDFNTSGFKW
jgi:hypothetical protein